MFDKKAYHKAYHLKYDGPYYQRNKKKIIGQKKEYKKKLREWYNNLKSSKSCSRCGESDPKCLDFHHIDPKTKIMNCGDFIRMNCKKRLLAEIEKCEVLCSNCHRKLS